MSSGATGAARPATASGAAAAGPAPLLVDEDEPIGTRGGNDTLATAQRVDRLRHRRGARTPGLRILGTLSPEPVAAEAVAPNTEDDGAIPLAGDTGIGTTREGITTSGVIGDGPHGSAGTGTGDFDFYAVDRARRAGADRRHRHPGAGRPRLDRRPVRCRRHADRRSTTTTSPPASPTACSSSGPRRPTALLRPGRRTPVAFQPDPNDSGSGFGVGSEGPYDVTITAGASDDVDFFAVRAAQGRRARRLGRRRGHPDRHLRHRRHARCMGSDQDAIGRLPGAVPLPGGGNAVADHVVDEAGWHYVGVTGGERCATTSRSRSYRPRLGHRAAGQTLFLDFDGARLNTGDLRWSRACATLSPFRAFLGRLGAAQPRPRRADRPRSSPTVRGEPAARTWWRAASTGTPRSGSSTAATTPTRSASPTSAGSSSVARSTESGIPTIGIAQSIDPGNFAHRGDRARPARRPERPGTATRPTIRR